jgi:oligopeptide transport system ATP-binding protein
MGIALQGGDDPMLLQVKDLQCHFDIEEGIINAVDGVSFDVAEGETLGLVGESGCGKSVTALAIMDLVPSPPGKVVGGQVLLDGVNLRELDDEGMRRVRGRKIAMIFQEPMRSLNPVLTIGRQITEAVQLHLGLDKAKARDRAVDLLRQVRISDPEQRLDQYPHQFSGGMCQRVMIAIAVACEPKLILADEPTTALDVTVQAQVLYAWHGCSDHHTQPRRRRSSCRSRGRDVRRKDRGASHHTRALRTSSSSVYHRTPEVRAPT